MNLPILESSLALSKLHDSGSFVESRSCIRTAEGPAAKLSLPLPLLCSPEDPQDEDDTEEIASDHSSLNTTADEFAVTKGRHGTPEGQRFSDSESLRKRQQSIVTKTATGSTFSLDFEKDDESPGFSLLPSNADFRIVDLSQKRERSSAVTPHKKASLSSSFSGKSVSFSESVVVHSHDDWSVRLAARREEKKRVKKARQKPLFRIHFPLRMSGRVLKPAQKVKKPCAPHWWMGIKGLCARLLSSCASLKKNAAFTDGDGESQVNTTGHSFRTLFSN